VGIERGGLVSGGGGSVAGGGGGGGRGREKFFCGTRDLMGETEEVGFFWAGAW